jgi:hypothetical protein
MTIENLILIDELSKHYEVEVTFFSSLNELGLIHITTIKSTQYIHQDQIQNLEKMIRMHHDLEINIPGIDVAFNLLNRINILQKELQQTKNRLNLYEN